jgi:hypothetical protein
MLNVLRYNFYLLFIFIDWFYFASFEKFYFNLHIQSLGYFVTCIAQNLFKNHKFWNSKIFVFLLFLANKFYMALFKKIIYDNF